MPQTLRIPLRVVFYKEAGRYLARCLEFDLVGDGTTRDESLRTLMRAIAIQVECSTELGNNSNLFSPADGKYFRMFSAGKDVASGQIELIQANNVVIQEAACREYEEFVVV